MSGAVPPVPFYDFMACTGTTLMFRPGGPIPADEPSPFIIIIIIIIIPPTSRLSKRSVSTYVRRLKLCTHF